LRGLLDTSVFIADEQDRTIDPARLPDEAAYVALPIDERVASAFAELVASARRSGRRPKVPDAWIAATARAHAVALFTRGDDFAAFPIDVVRV
jgi:predicted nucleic acid-binding protein